MTAKILLWVENKKGKAQKLLSRLLRWVKACRERFGGLKRPLSGLPKGCIVLLLKGFNNGLRAS